MTENINKNTNSIMDIAQLKQQIEDNEFNKYLIILVCPDDTAKFIAIQYLHFWASKNNSEIISIGDTSKVIGPTFFSGSMDLSEVYVHNTDTLRELPVVNAKCWIICNKVLKKVRNKVPESIVEVPKLEDWQIKDYIVTTCNITDEQASNLINEYRDLIKLDIEIKKLQIFKQNMYDEFKEQLFYTVDSSIFELVNALIQKNKDGLKDATENGIDDIEPFPFLTLLIKNMKAVIDIQLAKNPTAESVGMSGKQFYAVQKYSCGHYTRDQLLYLYDFLTQIDYQIKNGDLDVSNVVNYIITKFLIFMSE